MQIVEPGPGLPTLAHFGERGLVGTAPGIGELAPIRDDRRTGRERLALADDAATPIDDGAEHVEGESRDAVERHDETESCRTDPRTLGRVAPAVKRAFSARLRLLRFPPAPNRSRGTSPSATGLSIPSPIRPRSALLRADSFRESEDAAPSARSECAAAQQRNGRPAGQWAEQPLLCPRPDPGPDRGVVS